MPVGNHAFVVRKGHVVAFNVDRHALATGESLERHQVVDVDITGQRGGRVKELADRHFSLRDGKHVRELRRAQDMGHRVDCHMTTVSFKTEIDIGAAARKTVSRRAVKVNLDIGWRRRRLAGQRIDRRRAGQQGLFEKELHSVPECIAHPDVIGVSRLHGDFAVEMRIEAVKINGGQPLMAAAAMRSRARSLSSGPVRGTTSVVMASAVDGRRPARGAAATVEASIGQRLRKRKMWDRCLAVAERLAPFKRGSKQRQ
ncbi:hypothetical protein CAUPRSCDRAFT_12581 [Caulochytrium protostelioides]|uniref:Uncharacterized protein n=1 Tax=Caulochytrium protostelioides TaxID=1555241 RepID=A0A4P9WST9_9FUNG|nr:hypothetical protein CAUPRSCDRAFT_12581 [Caulochytrium protostelioides]